MTPAVRDALPVLAAFGLLAVGLAWTGPRLDTLTSAIVVATGAFAVLLHLTRSHGEVLDDWRVLLGGALLLRLLFLASSPDLSVDPQRYLWDGWLTAGGVNPYRYTPSDPALVDRQHVSLFREMNSRDFFSIYPPLSQWLFLPAGWLYERTGDAAAAFLALRAAITAAESVGLVLLLLAVRGLGRPPRRLALYAWNPLVLVAVPGVGHSEGGLVLGLGLLAFGLTRSRRTWAWAGLGLSAVSKGLPLLLAPLLLRHQLARAPARQALASAALGLLPAALLSLPFLFPGLPARLAASADLYVRLFEFNAGLHALLAAATQPLVGTDPRPALGPLLRGVFLGAALWIWLRHPARTPEAVLGGGLLLFGLYLATATTVHPWYLLWGLPLVAFTSRHRAAWIWASWAAFPTYLVYVGGPPRLTAALFWGGIALFVAAEEWPRIRDALLPLAGRRKARGIRPHLDGRTVLDLGAGEGYVGRCLARKGVVVLLADVAPLARVGLPSLVFDGRRLPLADASVDTVVLSLVLHHAADPDALLREAVRVAHRRIVITESTYRHGWERAALERVDRWVNRGRWGGAQNGEEGPLSFDTAAGWRRRIEAAGAEVIVSRRLNRVGHRHCLLVAVPVRYSGSEGSSPASLGAGASPNPPNSSLRSPAGDGVPPPLDRSSARKT